jgi:hypothetical protein
MKKLLFLLFSITLIFNSCKKEKIEGRGAIITEPRQVENFYNVSVSGSPNVFIIPGASFDVKVKAYENILPILETKVQNGSLLIGFKKNVSNDNSEVYITMPALSAVTTNGSGNIDTKGNFLGMDYFSATTSGSGIISIEKGSAKNYKISIAGSGDVKSFGFISDQATVSISGSGDAELSVTQKLKATLGGSGNVYYKGNPVVDVVSSGSGQAIKK